MSAFPNLRNLFRRSTPVPPALDEFGLRFAALAVRLGVQSSLEIGAHAAEFSVAMAETVSVAVALEASPYVFARYERLLPKTLTYLHRAAAGTDGSVALRIPTALGSRKGSVLDRANPISSILPRVSRETRYEVVDVPAVRLPTLVAEFALKDAALWIDVEGATGEVLAGHELCIRDHFLCAMVEVEETAYWQGQWLRHDVERFFRASGFSPLADDAGGRPQYNLVFVADHLRELARQSF